MLGYPFAMGEKITKVMPPPVMGKDVPLAKIFDEAHDRYKEGGEFRALYDADVEVKKVVDQAKGLEGLKRQWGVHAAGVIMSSDPLLDLIPIMKREQDGAIITQFDYPTCEKLGLIKMDFLGLRNLTVLDDAVRNIKANRDEDIVLEELPLDDRPTYDLLARGDTLGVFHSTAVRCGRCCARCGRTISRTSPQSSPCTGPGPWVRTRTTSTPTARPVASRSYRSTRSSPRRRTNCSATPTA